MSQINVNRIKDSNEGAPDFPSGVNVGGITSTVTLGVTNLNPTNLNVSGVVTATTLDGNLLATGTPTLGLGVTINTSGVNISGVATAGIVSATTLYGDGTNITGIALTIAPLNYNPAVLGSDVSISPGIGITFNQAVKAGSGEVTLRIAGAAGTVVQNWGVGNSITYSNGDTISLSLVSNLSNQEVYHLSYPSGAFTTIGGDVSYVGTAYTFSAKPVYNRLWLWGDNESGALGQNSTILHSSPVQVPGNNWDTFSIASANGSGNAFGIKTDGTLWAWGRNYRGSLGLNQVADDSNDAHYSSPVQIPGTTWATVHHIAQKVEAVKTDGTLWVWGENQNGQLGQNNTVFYSSPVQVPGTTWSKTAYKINGSLAETQQIKTDGTMWAWGSNAYGQVGNSSRAQASSPIQIPGTTWNRFVSGGGDVVIAIKTDGTLWTWGDNVNGQGGLNARGRGTGGAARSSPVQVPGTTWRSGVCSVSSAIYTKTDGTLWACGSNTYGQLGQNHIANRSSPVQIGSDTDWSGVVGSANRLYFATKTDGTMWAWGRDYNGSFGLNLPGNTMRSSPVQIPGTDWPKTFPETTKKLVKKGVYCGGAIQVT
jgi:alpha-tubulin suppressor-like RCC1 family protein